MGFLDNLSNTIAETGQGIRDMADRSSAKSLLQGELRRKEKELEALVYQMGLQMVSNEPEVCQEKCPELYSQLINARETAKELRNQIALLEVEIICPGCGRTIKGAQQFCTYCGSILPEPNLNMNRDYTLTGLQMPNQAGAVCAKCGSPLRPGAAFCVNCGEPVAKNESAENL
ncbi:MAG: zinc ribbon domain-containing protein [Mogibacterium sp.]|nr:zinc ribbon domain-containing protein [Mogibacterium sp.]